MKLGNYTIEKQIGEGGFARTYLARHVELDKRVCIKQSIETGKDAQTLMRSEAKKLWDLEHHSLPSVKDYFTLADGSAALVMKYIPGKDLHEIVKEKKAIHQEDVCWMTQRLLNALHYMHHHGVVHADVKPANIIPDAKHHNSYLIDFGLSAKRPKGDTASIGYTPVYSAPEIESGKPPIPESDFFSLGLSMIYALGGDPASKKIPSYVDDRIGQYFGQMIRYNPKDRPRFEDKDLIKELSDIRLSVFGRRSTQ